jgi:hypothetical protein
MALSGDLEFSNSNMTSEKSFMVRLLLLLLLRLEFEVTFRVGIGIEAVVSRGLFICESILSEFEFELLAKGVGGERALDDCDGGDNSKSGDDASNLRKLFDEELQS